MAFFEDLRCSKCRKKTPHICVFSELHEVVYASCKACGKYYEITSGKVWEKGKQRHVR